MSTLALTHLIFCVVVFRVSFFCTSYHTSTQIIITLRTGNLLLVVINESTHFLFRSFVRSFVRIFTSPPTVTTQCASNRMTNQSLKSLPNYQNCVLTPKLLVIIRCLCAGGVINTCHYMLKTHVNTTSNPNRNRDSLHSTPLHSTPLHSNPLHHPIIRITNQSSNRALTQIFTESLNH